MKKETACKRLRRNKEYYLRELEQNAKRDRERDYKRDGKLHKKRRRLAGFYVRREWTEDEITYLKENRFIDYLEIALELERSLSSIEHKIIRLGLQKNNKWK